MTSLPSHEEEKLNEFGNLFNLSNLVKSDTCFTKTHGSKIDWILANNSNSFQKSGTKEIGLSDFHKLIIRPYTHTFPDLDQKLNTTEITKTLMNQNLLKI